jgi:SOS response regulatory protein OraA/RecX
MGMPGNRIAHKHFRLNAAKIKRAQKLMQAGTETETIERALDAVITEHERNEAAREANERFAKSGVVIRDVYGTLEK